MNTTAGYTSTSVRTSTKPVLSFGSLPEFYDGWPQLASGGHTLLQMIDASGSYLPRINCHVSILHRLDGLMPECKSSPIATVRCDRSFDLTDGVPEAMHDWLHEYAVGPITLGALVDFALSVSPEHVPRDVCIVPYGYGHSLTVESNDGQPSVPILQPTQVGRWVLGLEPVASVVRRGRYILGRCTKESPSVS